ncbi:hypothetical protein V6N11_035068 [Hibiscus sabdariffa]|uniref:S-protein homolog n=1 Tax=Hibiscus sabdariffa TaxID=183260 RepID=A0ABR2QZ96_9ROSI
MSISSGSLMVLFLWISLLSQTNFGEALLKGRKYHVHVANGFSNNNQLTIHCASKDDDLGEHVLQVSQEWSWSFRENFWGTTQFWCNMNGEGHSKTVDVFVMEWGFLDTCGDKECFWSVRDDGIYLQRNKDGTWLKEYDW